MHVFENKNYSISRGWGLSGLVYLPCILLATLLLLFTVNTWGDGGKIIRNTPRTRLLRIFIIGNGNVHSAVSGVVMVRRGCLIWFTPLVARRLLSVLARSHIVINAPDVLKNKRTWRDSVQYPH